jgi:hypothetical protein
MSPLEKVFFMLFPLQGEACFLDAPRAFLGYKLTVLSGLFQVDSSLLLCFQAQDIE